MNRGQNKRLATGGVYRIQARAHHLHPPARGDPATGRAAQRDPAWQQRYRADRPIVERKISRFTRRAWGGRKARTRGLARITTDLITRAAALNWARLAILGLYHDQAGWTLPAT